MRCFSVLPPMLLMLLLNLATAASPPLMREDALVQHYPVGSIQTVQQASEALLEVSTTRKQVEDDHVLARNACLEKFFMSVCFDRAKDRRRLALAAIRKIEIEASAYLRKEKADERDRGVAERQRNAALPLESPGIPFKGAARPDDSPDAASDKP